MKSVFVLFYDYGRYVGYGAPEAVWDHDPTDQEIFDYLYEKRKCSQPDYGFLTVEETNASIAKRIWEDIENGWEIQECDFVGDK
jgi:hypothetical protein